MNHWLLLESQFDSGDGQELYIQFTCEVTKMSFYEKDYMFIQYLEIHIWEPEKKEVKFYVVWKVKQNQNQKYSREGQHLFSTSTLELFCYDEIFIFVLPNKITYS